MFFTALMLVFVGCDYFNTNSKNNRPLEKSELKSCEEPAWDLNVDSIVQLFVKEVVKGDTIFVVHGGFGAEHSYLITALKDIFSEYHFVFYDQRGSLRSQSDKKIQIRLNHAFKNLINYRPIIGLMKSSSICKNHDFLLQTEREVSLQIA